MGELTAVFVVGFVVLGIYKLFELFVRKRERMALIEKLPALFDLNVAGKVINFPEISFMKRDNGSWPLRISLLFIGVGLGCLLAFVVQYTCFDVSSYNFNEWGDRQNLGHIRFVLYFSFIAIFGGLSLFIAFLIERQQAKKQDSSVE